MPKIHREIWTKIRPDIKAIIIDLSRLIIESILLISIIISIWLVDEAIIVLFSSPAPFKVYFLILISDAILIFSFAKKSIKDLFRE